MDLISNFIGKKIINNIGGTIRWVFGSIYRIILNKPRIEFNEYLNGFDPPNDHFTKKGYNYINRLIAFGFLLILTIIFVF